jgi:hypothetical protein
MDSSAHPSRRAENRFSLGPPPIRRTEPILLNAGRAQSGQAVTIDRTLPSKEFVGRQPVTPAGLFKRQQSTPNGGDDFGFATNYPACGPRCWEISKCQRATIRADDIFHFRALDSTISSRSAKRTHSIVPSFKTSLLPMKQSTERRSAVNHGHLPVPTPQHGLPRERLGRGRRLRGHGRDLCTVAATRAGRYTSSTRAPERSWVMARSSRA